MPLMRRAVYSLVLPCLVGCYQLGFRTERYVSKNNGAPMVQVVFLNRGCGRTEIFLDGEWGRRGRRDVKPLGMNPVGSWGNRMKIKLPAGPHVMHILYYTHQSFQDRTESYRDHRAGSFTASEGAEVNLC
jgi:hypothetical protein